MEQKVQNWEQYATQKAEDYQIYDEKLTQLVCQEAQRNEEIEVQEIQEIQEI